jgi:hypothetical protein
LITRRRATCATRLNLDPHSADDRVVNLERCPYDGSPISVRRFGDSFEISCDACGAGWEMHGSFLRRLRPPDAETMKAVRDGLFSEEVLCGKRVSATVDDAAR